jgi:glucose dehydrogenase
MGTNSTQAFGVALFLIAFTLISVGMSRGGSFFFILPGLVLLGISGAVFLRAKSLEQEDN